MRTRWQVRGAVVLLALLGSAPPRVEAADLSAGRVRAFEQALASHDVTQWDASLRSLARMDHPAGVHLLARFYVEQVTYEGTWKNRRGRSATRVFSSNLDALYARRLAGHRNVRSLRAMVEVLDDEARRETAMFAAALKDHPALHLVEGVLRKKLERALRQGRETLARRHLALLRGRLHVGDAAWMEKWIVGTQRTGALRLELLAALPVHDLWTRVLDRQAKKPLFDESALAAVVATQLGAPAADLGAARALLARAAHDAEQIASAVSTPAKLDVVLRAMAPWRARAALHTAHQRRWQALLAEPLMADFMTLHDAFVEVRYARAWRRDSYRFRKGQRQAFDRKIDDAKVEARAPVVDFALPPLAAHVEGLEALRRAVAATTAPAGSVWVPAPFHPDILALNAKQPCTVRSVAFTPEERAWRTRRDEVRAYNARARCASELERRNAELVNDYRLSYDLLPVRIDADLTTSARKHSDFQRAVGRIAHSFRPGAEPEGRTPGQRMARAGYPPKYIGGENVLVGSQDPAAAFRWWRASPGHRSNMLTAAWTEIGVGRSGRYWTQNFGREPYDEDHDE